MVGSAGINRAKILSKKKTEKSEEKQGAIPTRSAEITQQPKPTPTHALVIETPKISPDVTEKQRRTKRVREKRTVTAEPKKTIPTNVPVITAAPTRQPESKKIISTLEPTAKVTEKPNSMDVELEDNSMNILVEE